MKVLHVTPLFTPDKGGITDHVFFLCMNLKTLGIDIHVLAPRQFNIKYEEGLNFDFPVTRLNSISLMNWPYPLRSVRIPIDLGLRIDSTISKGSFDIVHVHSHHFPVSWLAIRSAHKYGIPCVLTLHGTYGLNPKVLGGKTRTEDWFNKYIFARILAKTDAVIGLTSKITKYAANYGSETIRYFTIPNGVNSTIFITNMNMKSFYRRKYGVDEHSDVILFCGRFELVKGAIEFAEAAKRIVKNSTKKVEVFFVGSGSLAYDLELILKGVENVRLMGWVSREVIHEIYLLSDIFAIPSRYEGLPLALLEAMSAGLHVVYSPVGGMPEILDGYSCKSTLKDVSSDQIYKTLTELISKHQDLKATSLDIEYSQRFDWKHIAKEISSVYLKLKKS